MARMEFTRFILRAASDPLSALRFLRLARMGVSTSTVSDPVICSFRARGRSLRIALRPGATDIGSFAEVFHQGLYELPGDFAPKVIVDVGANIGAAMLYFAARWPDARIFAFEPVSANFAMLQRNIALNDLGGRVTAVHCGLGSTEARLPIYQPGPNQFWGCTLNPVAGQHPSETVHIRAADEALATLGVREIDLLKIDCEGAEAEVLASLGDRIRNVRHLVAELHAKLVDVPLLIERLRQTHEILSMDPPDGDCIHVQARRLNDR